MKTVRIIGLFLVLASLLTFSLPLTALAQEGEPAIEEKITLSPTYPTLENIAGQDFGFEVTFNYTGTTPKDFDIRPTAPQGWEVYMTPPYEKEKKVSAIHLEPFSVSNKLNVVATAPFFPLPDPGDYKITIEAVSGNLKGSTELIAKVTARYTLNLVPAGQLYNTKATAGKDNVFSIEAQNLGTAPIDTINLSSTKPEGWTITFVPDKVDTLPAIDRKTIDVKIKPPAETIAGDYSITLQASGKQATATNLELRITVETPTIWGWVGVGIILLVLIGLTVIFMRFSRR